MQQAHAVGHGEGLLGMVGGEDDRQAAFVGQPAHLLQHAHLIAEVEAGGRFVEHQNVRRLGQRPRDQRQLPLAAADAQPVAPGQMRDAETLQRRLGGCMVAGGRGGERAAMSGAAHQNHLAHAEGELTGAGLRHIAEGQRAAARVPAADILAIDTDATATQREQAEDRLEQRRLAAAVGSEQAENLARLHGKADPGADGPLAIAEGQILDGKPRAHNQPRRPKASSQRNTGVPITAVSTPSGNSTWPMPRDSVSTANR